MRALLRRFRFSVGLWGTVYVVGGIVLGVLLLAFGDPRNAAPTAGAFTVLVLLMVAATGYRRSARVPDHISLLGVDGVPAGRFCLLLRPFGGDGEMVLPRAWKSGRIASNGAFVYSRTVEQVVTRAVRETLGLGTYAVVDQRVRLAPPGPAFLRVPDEQWQEVVGRLITHAAAIVLVLPPGRDPGDGFGWELDEIGRMNPHPPVLLVLASTNRNGTVTVPDEDELGRAARVLDRLDSAAGLPSGGNRIREGTMVVRHAAGEGSPSWGAGPAARRSVVADRTYHAAIGAALSNLR